MSVTIGTVIVTYFSASTLDACLSKLLAQCDAHDVVVVDNGSSDGSGDIARKYGVRLRTNANNPGFAVACNQGAQMFLDEADAPDYLLFLNPDCFLPPQALMDWHQAATSCAMPVVLGCQHADAQGALHPASHRRHPDMGRALVHALGRTSAGERGVQLQADSNQAIQPVEAISGAAMFVSRGVFEQLRGFDEGYRLHCEDLDFCRRAQVQGAHVAVVNGIVATHLQGTSSRRRPYWVEWQKHRGMRRYASKFAASPWPQRLMEHAAIGVHLLWRWLKISLSSKR